MPSNSDEVGPDEDADQQGEHRYVEGERTADVERVEQPGEATAFTLSLAWTAIHWDSKFCCDKKPVSAVGTESTNAATPRSQVARRRPRQVRKRS